MTYEEQLSAAKHRAERDQARQEAKGLREELETAEAEYRRHRANLDARYEKKADESRRRGQAMHGMSRLIRERNEEIKALKERIADMEPRLMPEGMEWPRYESGEPVIFESMVADDRGCSAAAMSFEFSDDRVYIRDFEGFPSQVLAVGERVKRPAVLAADGKPLREGETVYQTDSTTEFIVDDIMAREDGATVVHLKGGAWNLPQNLTHERPESWERLEADAKAAVCVYFGVSDKDCGSCGHSSWECSYDKARDLVRRCKALAGVSE